MSELVHPSECDNICCKAVKEMLLVDVLLAKAKLFESEAAHQAVVTSYNYMLNAEVKLKKNHKMETDNLIATIVELQMKDKQRKAREAKKRRDEKIVEKESQEIKNYPRQLII